MLLYILLKQSFACVVALSVVLPSLFFGFPLSNHCDDNFDAHLHRVDYISTIYLQVVPLHGRKDQKSEVLWQEKLSQIVPL